METPKVKELDRRYVDAAVVRLCELSLYEFVMEAWKVVEPGTPFIGNWHIQAICEHLEACTRGEIRRMIINVPPRSMKSRLVGVFWPAWVWITRPNTRWLYASYAHQLSLRDSIHCRDVIMSSWYQRHWGSRFQFREDQNQKTRFDNDRSGFRLASSTGGVGTGEGGDFIIADDPHNVTEAESEVQRDAVLHWWDQSMSTRGNDPRTVCHVVVMQRLHENDLAGHLLEQGGYEHLCLPMEFEPARRCRTSIGWQDPRQKRDELLSPERFPREAVDELKLRLGSYGSAGQLQQRPAPLEGGMFQRGWFRVAYRLPTDQQFRRVRYWDLAASLEGDYTCGVRMCRSDDGTFYIDDVKRGRWSPAERDAVIRRTAQADGYDVQIMLEQEPGSAGMSVTSYLIRSLAGYTVRADKPTGAKEVRAQPFAAQCEAKNVCILRADWNLAYLDELSVFPNGRHDDQVDASSGAFNRLARFSIVTGELPQHIVPECFPSGRHGVHIDMRSVHARRYGHRKNEDG